VEVEPILLSSWSIRKTGEILICSLWRKLVEMAVHSCVKTVAARSTRLAIVGNPLTLERPISVIAVCTPASGSANA
jgi:hypothetical protein